MKLYVKYISFFVLISLPIQGFCYQPLVVGVSIFPPYTVRSEKQITGINVEFYKLLFSRISVNYELRVYPRKRLNGLISNGSLVGFGAKGASTYNDKVYFSELPVFSVTLRVYSHKNRKTINSIEDFRGKSVLLVSGYEYDGLIDYLLDSKNAIRVQRTRGHDSAFMMLAAGRGVDYLISYDVTSEHVLMKLASLGLKHTELKSFDIYFSVPKIYPNAKELIGKVNGAMRQLKIEGELDRLYKNVNI